MNLSCRFAAGKGKKMEEKEKADVLRRGVLNKYKVESLKSLNEELKLEIRQFREKIRNQEAKKYENTKEILGNHNHHFFHIDGEYSNSKIGITLLIHSVFSKTYKILVEELFFPRTNIVRY